MRIAPRFVVLAALAVAGCGGKAKPTEIENQATPPPKAAWTVDRALATMPPDTTAVVYADIDHLRGSELVGAYLDQLTAPARAGMSAECAELKWTGKVVAIISGERDAVNATVFAVGVGGEELRQCMANAPARPGTKLVVDGDAFLVSFDGGSMGIQILDDHTAVMAFATGKGRTVDRVVLEGATTERPNAATLPELGELRASSLPVWAVASGTSSLFASSPMKFRTATFTAAVDAKLALDLRVKFAKKDEATLIAQTIQSQGQMAVSMGFVTVLDAHADGDVAVVHAEATKASIDKMVGMMRSFGGGGAMSPFGPPPPPGGP
jgi:hypothetical protein